MKNKVEEFQLANPVSLGSLASKNDSLTDDLDITEVTKSQRNRRRQRRLQIFSPVATMRQMRQLPHLKFQKKICLRSKIHNIFFTIYKSDKGSFIYYIEVRNYFCHNK